MNPCFGKEFDAFAFQFILVTQIREVDEWNK
jgi:hypothetical protein